MTSFQPTTPGRDNRGPTNSILLEKLSAALPKGHQFRAYHVSTPPTRCDALCSAPPGERDDRTYSENHLLAVSIDAPKPVAAAANDKPEVDTTDTADEGGPPQVLVLAVEIYVYTTAFSTTLFVSKADSTGYMHLLDLPRGAPSPAREVCTAFVAFLTEQRRRPGIQTVVSLFARAQDQYLFPGSVEYAGKHVLDDRGLIKWWCRVLDPVLEGARAQQQRTEAAAGAAGTRAWASVKGYLTIPGLDLHETRAFLPRTPAAAANWVLGHPLGRISHYTREHDGVPPRCLIPRFPDDPKSRFRDELDEEAGKSQQLQDTGAWRSVRSLDQFWEMLAFRQECSGGRTGFIWIVLDPEGAEAAEAATEAAAVPSTNTLSNPIPPCTPPRKRHLQLTPQSSPLKAGAASSAASSSNPKKTDRQKLRKPLTGKITPRQPHAKTRRRNYLLDRPATTAYYAWTPAGRGERIVDAAGYRRVLELLLRLDFANLALAAGSTRRWVGEVGAGAPWGGAVVGRREVLPLHPAGNGAGAAATAAAGAGAGAGQGAGVTNVLSGLVKKKKVADGAAKVNNMLGSGLVRKKAKDGDAAACGSEGPGVNVLGGGLVRRKPKA